MQQSNMFESSWDGTIPSEYPAFEIEGDGGYIAFEQDSDMPPDHVRFEINGKTVELNYEQLERFGYKVNNMRNIIHRAKVGLPPGEL